jgi:Icc protein
VNVLHLTDSHIQREPDTVYKGLDPRLSLQAIVRDACEQDWQADLVLLTGDMSHDGSIESYEFLRDIMQALPQAPVYHLPGNHDQADVMRAVLQGGNLSSDRYVLHGGWQFILLDSCLPDDEVGGELAEMELDFLSTCLASNPQFPALVALHHQPVDVGSSWIDAVGLSNKQQFNKLIHTFPQVRAVLWGHVHQEFSLALNDVLYMTTPSTWVQFMPGADVCLYDDLQPGYRRIQLQESGRISTSVHRLKTG